MRINFYLKRASVAPDTETAIVCHVLFNGHRLKLPVGISIAPKYWNAEKQRPKRGYASERAVNARLDHIAASVTTEYVRQCNEGKSPTPESMRKALRQNLPAGRSYDLFEVYEQYIKDHEGRLSAGTIKGHNAALAKLRKFAKTYGLKLFLLEMNLPMLEKLATFLLRVEQLNNGSAWNIIKCLRAVLQWAREQSISLCTDYERFTKKRLPEFETSSGTFLTLPELRQVIAADLSENERLQRIRDLFLFQCLTGVRYSDLAKLRPEHRQEDVLVITTQKNRKPVRIPLVPAALSIWEQYEGQLPIISNQKYNDGLKDLGVAAKLTNPCIEVTFRGAERIEKTYEKHELLSSHSAKRTYVSLLRQRGVSLEAILSATGNSRGTIGRYIKWEETEALTEVGSALSEL